MHVYVFFVHLFGYIFETHVHLFGYIFETYLLFYYRVGYSYEFHIPTQLPLIKVSFQSNGNEE